MPRANKGISPLFPPFPDTTASQGGPYATQTALDQEIADRITDVNAEETARIAAVTSEIANRIADVDAEEAARITAVNSVQLEIDAEETARAAADVARALNTVVLTAGSGLVGGGNLTANRTFDVGVGAGILARDNDVAIDQSSSYTPTYSGVHTFFPGTAGQLDALVIHQTAPASAGTRDSNVLRWRGGSFDTGAHTTDWQTFVDVTSNAGVSQWSLQSRIDAAAFVTRLSITDDGQVVAVQGSVTLPSWTFVGQTAHGWYSGGTNIIAYAAAGFTYFEIGAGTVTIYEDGGTTAGTDSSKLRLMGRVTGNVQRQISLLNEADATLQYRLRIEDSDATKIASFEMGGQGAFAMHPWGASAGNTGEVRFHELTVSGTNYVGFKSQDYLQDNTIWVLPSGLADVSEAALISDTSGRLSWSLGTNDPHFGDGSDGPVIVSTSTQLARDMYYDGLTITGAGSLDTGGFRVFVRGRLVINTGGSLSNDGSNGVAAATGDGADPGSLAGGGDGGAGGTSGDGGPGIASANSIGGAGGIGGDTAAGNPGAAGAAGALAANEGGIRTAPFAIMGAAMGMAGTANMVLTAVEGGAGGGGGATAGPGDGGGGGGGGGIMVVVAKEIVNNGTIRANGGAGGDGASGAGGGGGGGGGGVILVYRRKSGTGTITATGGSAGSGGSPAAAAGSSGSVIEIAL